MAGPPPKPPERRQRRNTKEFGLVKGGGMAVPPAPKDLLTCTKKAWDEYWVSPVAQTIDPVSDLPAVERLFTLRDERERCYRSAQKGRLVEGSQGQLVLNPLYRHMSTLDGEIRQMEDRLGLTPMARLKLGVQMGEAKRSLDQLNAEVADDDDDYDDGDDPRIVNI